MTHEANELDSVGQRHAQLDLARDDIALRAEGPREGTRARRRIGHELVAAASGLADRGEDVLAVIVAVSEGEERHARPVTPHDLGLESMIGAAKRDFVGKRSLARADLRAANRKQLVGLLTEDPRLALEEGAQLVADPRERAPMSALGHVTSSYESANCGRSIAMALLAGGRARLGETVYATARRGFAA